MALVLVREIVADQGLTLIAGQPGLDRKIISPEVHRPGLELAGFFEHFGYERIIVLGRTELAYLGEQPPETRKVRLRQLLFFNIPCIIVTDDLLVLDELIDLCNQKGIPILRTAQRAGEFIYQLSRYLHNRFAPRKSVHGVFVEVYGVGILIMGPSGIGKSECALELIKRGHRLVADDAVQLTKISDHKIVGSPDEMIRHHMEIRGLGIIDIQALFGISATAEEKPVELVIQFEKWDDKKEYDRLGILQKTIKFLKVEVPITTIPVREGRNLAVVVETAAMNYYLKRMGITSAENFARQLQSKMLKNR
ncbi:MAG: HPr kinase/phosphorylase [Candidatus Ozemobacter sibiricus]|jgi:HPr kinase/phosphorylase|uniref:HPr kinase/phosphorylase n=1 Tax=Candidatus Ozemobacter sibiricus TaxID=2268124 RepID=A0A367ZLG7_9BACT|nr:MAG: HPr kinase/phosphorylase [Candidatus Ozemobacter sibiricus]